MTSQQLVERALVAHPDRIALVDGDRRISFELLRDRTARLANALLGLGAGLDRPVALLLPNCFQYMEADVAAMRAGVTRVGINPRLAPGEWEFILGDSGAAVLITTSAMLEQLDPPALDGVEAVLTIDGVGPSARNGGEGTPRRFGYEDCLYAARPALDVPMVSPDDPSYVLYTSGTTGRPKGATHTHGGRLSAAVNMASSELRLGPGSAMLHVGPLTHGSGSKLLPVLAAGGASVVLSRFDPQLFAETVEREGITNTFLVPTMIQRLCEAPEKVRSRIAAMDRISFGGAPISASGFERAIEAFGPILTQVYGSCEAPHPITLLRPEDYLGNDDRAEILESAGRAAWGSELRLAGDGETDESGAVTGELSIRTSHLMSGYWGNPEATAAAIDGDGWYRTGDIVSLAHDGLVTFRDRERDLIISGGYNVYPAEVERAVSEHAEVAEVAVVSYPSEEWGESVLAYVVTEPGSELDERQVTDWVRSRLAGYKKPRRVEFVEELPHGPSGKVDKKVLKDALWQGQARRVN